MASIDLICEQLKDRGRRMTPQRRAIIQVLLKDKAHLTADQIFTRVRGMMPDISHATVYNTLHELVEMGALLELDLGLGERFYDIVTTDHAHLVCLDCGRVEDVPYDGQSLTLSPDHAFGFEIIDHIVIFRGYCPSCISNVDNQDGA